MWQSERRARPQAPSYRTNTKPPRPNPLAARAAPLRGTPALRITRIRQGFYLETAASAASICHGRGVSFRTLSKPTQERLMNAQGAVLPSASTDINAVLFALSGQ